MSNEFFCFLLVAGMERQAVRVRDFNKQFGGE